MHHRGVLPLNALEGFAKASGTAVHQAAVYEISCEGILPVLKLMHVGALLALPLVCRDVCMWGIALQPQ